MDSYSQSSGFMDLLASQQESQWVDALSTEVGESEVHVFSRSNAPSQGECIAEDRRSRNKWSPLEDVVLISAWLNTSKDPIVGNEQKAEAFWKRITAYFSQSPKLVGFPKREPSHCKQRWGKINDIVCKFVGSYEAASSQKSSGQNENDVMKLANQIYFNDHKSKFTLEHAWRELRHDRKWCQNEKEGSGISKRGRIEDESTARPPGVKASKAKKNVTNAASVSGDGKSLLELQSMWEIKQKDFILKEKLSKHKMLESLLAKTEPLDDVEIALKNKLISDMLA